MPTYLKCKWPLIKIRNLDFFSLNGYYRRTVKITVFRYFPNGRIWRRFLQRDSLCSIRFVLSKHVKVRQAKLSFRVRIMVITVILLRA